MMNKEIENYIKIIESDYLHMSGEEYRNKIKEYNVKNKIENKNKRCEKFLMNYIESHNGIIYSYDKKQTYTLKNDEQIKSCWKDKSGCEELPFYWFCTSSGTLLVVHCDTSESDKPFDVYFLTPQEYGKGSRGDYRFIHRLTNKYRVIKAYLVTSLSFSESLNPESQYLLDKVGLYAFFQVEMLNCNLQGHHLKSVKDYPSHSYYPSNIEILPQDKHKNLHKIRSTILKSDDFKKEMENLIKSSKKENGNEIVITIRASLDDSKTEEKKIDVKAMMLKSAIDIWQDNTEKNLNNLNAAQVS